MDLMPSHPRDAVLGHEQMKRVIKPWLRGILWSLHCTKTVKKRGSHVLLHVVDWRMMHSDKVHGLIELPSEEWQWSAWCGRWTSAAKVKSTSLKWGKSLVATDVHSYQSRMLFASGYTVDRFEWGRRRVAAEHMSDSWPEQAIPITRHAWPTARRWLQLDHQSI